MHELRPLCRILALGVLTLPAAPSLAGLWDDPQNLEELPRDISPDELRETMRSFATSTGSRCFTCHVGEVEADLSTYDFTLDDKEPKRKARHMIRMVNDINAYLASELGKPAADLVRVECATCHRGRPKPEMLDDVIEHAYREGGLRAALAEYRELRDRYYGDYAFDFSPRPMLMLAERLAANQDYDAAVRFLDLNMEFHPDSTRTLQVKAQVQAAAGDRDGARSSLLEALKIEPENAFSRQLLDRLDAARE